jgi:methionyl-tRNA formyltransferase
LRTVYLGTSPFAAAVLERLAAGPHRPALVVTRPDRPKGRGRALQSPAVAESARRLGIELIQPERPHEPDALERIAAAEPDVLVVCAYGVLVSEPLLSSYEIVNVHPSLLPRWRGAAPIERAIMAGDAETGVSIMRVVAELDAGPVYLRESEPIRPDDDYGTLAARLARLAGALLVRALDERPEPVPQDDAQATYAAKIEAADRNLDPRRTSEELERIVRALRPHIGARLPLPGGGFLGVWAARAEEGGSKEGGPETGRSEGDRSEGGRSEGDRSEEDRTEGGRVHTEGDRLLLDCAGGALDLLEIQPPGGRRMPAADWLRGRPDPALTSFSV